MPKKRYIVDLTDTERTELLRLTKKGQVSARKLNRAHILLQADEGALDEEIASSLHVGGATVARIRKRFVEGNLEWALTETQIRDGDYSTGVESGAFLHRTAQEDSEKCLKPSSGVQ